MSNSEEIQSYASTSAVASWNGFLYQGKVALYVSIRMMLSDQNSSGFKLRLEHLDDFAIFDSDDNVVSLHQVKATVSKYRSSYEGALSQASKIYSKDCDGNTKRYFHVSTNIDNFKDYGEGDSLVTFYKNHVNDQFIGLDDIENYITNMIDQIAPPISTELTLFRYNKLLSLIDSRVNYIHAVNQKTSANQFEATDQNPISFQEIKTILESVYPEDAAYYLELFRRDFIDVLDKFAGHRDDNGNCVSDLVECKKAISLLDKEQLQQLYFSFDPTKESITNNCSHNDLDVYMDILCKLKNLTTKYELPHYKSNREISFLPTGFSWKESTEEFRLQKVRENIETTRAHPQLINLFFEYNNFIVDMPEQVEQSIQINSKVTHDCVLEDEDFISETHYENLGEKNVMRPRSVRFVSADVAKRELGEG